MSNDASLPTLPQTHYLNAEKGLKSWLTTVDHKRIAIMYLIAIAVFFVVAMFLGWAFANEPLTFRSVVAAAIILASVVVITTEASPNPRRSASRAKEKLAT